MIFKGNWLKQYKPSCTSGNMVNLFIVLEWDVWPQELKTVFNLKACFSGVVKLTKNADPDKYSYSGYGIKFDSQSRFLISNSKGKNVIIFGVGNSFSVHTDNKKKYLSFWWAVDAEIR